MPDIQLKPLGLVDKAALEFLQSKKLLPGFSHYDVWLHEHAVAFTVAKMMDADMLAETKAALQDALQNGTDFNTFKQRLKPYLMSQGWWGEQIMLDPLDGEAKIVQLGSTRRLETIFQTNMATSFAAGQWSRIQTNKAALPYLRYNPSASGNPRDAHKPYYNMILPVDHELWSQIYPPNGYGCLCTVSQLTRRQAEREGITEEPEVAMTEFVNPRTGEVVNIPANITPSFAHNHGDRLGALEALFGDKHGVGGLDAMIQAREDYLQQRYAMPLELNQVSFAELIADKVEIERLLVDPLDKTPKLSEAIAATLWQQAYKTVLNRYQEVVVPSPDFVVVASEGAWSVETTLDFMYTMDGMPQYNVDNFNKNFAITAKAWASQQQNIQKHLAKADIVPMDMRRMSASNQLMLLNYVLSLPKEQRIKIVLILG